MLEWLVVSTVCFWGQSCTDSVAFVYENDKPRNIIVAESPYCVQQVSISTFQPAPKEDEAVYRVLPEKSEPFYFNNLLDEIEWLAKVSANPRTTDITRRAANQAITKIRTMIQENALDKKVDELYYPHIHRWQGPYPETLHWEKCYCGKRRRKVTTERWAEE